MIPARICDTPGCGTTVPGKLDTDGIDQTHSKLPAWVWDCIACSRKRIEPARETASFPVEKEEPPPAVGWSASATPARRAGDNDPR